MLLARRMVEAGAGFVTVHSAGWDMHADGNNPGMVKGMNMLGWTLDRAVSAFLQDLEDRGLAEKVLLVLTGDFGRTPTINKKGGRDHWAKLGTLAFAGGGLPDWPGGRWAPTVDDRVDEAKRRTAPMDCHERECGTGLFGGNCGSCPPGQICIANQCYDIPPLPPPPPLLGIGRFPRSISPGS